ncbi:hypothetical protein DYL59_07505 [Pseudomonas kairouanensis]|uniref:Uncharacterized protein n=1 Tax=Pseudomonas kairouanensis TaxID=2293832 RepID=A0A4Z0AWJ8_9PSED|nr:hypothetical protein [Pseudomonas kairouanensis]TFY90820.1 hypothetical protein DYL59_07505 [Pseudomonas kairouanensis]
MTERVKPLYQRIAATLAWCISLGHDFMTIAPRTTLTVQVAHLCAQVLLILTFFLPIKIVVLLGSDTVPAYLPPWLQGVQKNALIVGLSVLTVLLYALHLGAGIVVNRYARAGARALINQGENASVLAAQLPLATRVFSRFTRGLSDASFALMAFTGLLCLYPSLMLVCLVYFALATAALMALHSRHPRIRSILACHPLAVCDAFYSTGFLATFAFMILDFLYLIPPPLYVALISLIVLRQSLNRLKSMSQDILFLSSHARHITSMRPAAKRCP